MGNASRSALGALAPSTTFRANLTVRIPRQPIRFARPPPPYLPLRTAAVVLTYPLASTRFVVPPQLLPYRLANAQACVDRVLRHLGGA